VDYRKKIKIGFEVYPSKDIYMHCGALQCIVNYALAPGSYGGIDFPGQCGLFTAFAKLWEFECIDLEGNLFYDGIINIRW